MPELGLPVSFTDINHAAVICEVLEIREDLVTEVSLGTHFFNDLVELDMLYVGLSPGGKGSFFDRAWLQGVPDLLTTLMPEAARYEGCIRVVQGSEEDQERLFLWADTQKQQVCLYRSS